MPAQLLEQLFAKFDKNKKGYLVGTQAKRLLNLLMVAEPTIQIQLHRLSNKSTYTIEQLDELLTDHRKLAASELENILTRVVPKSLHHRIQPVISKVAENGMDQTEFDTEMVDRIVQQVFGNIEN